MFKERSLLRTLSIIITVVLLSFALTACGGGTAPDTAPPDEPKTDDTAPVVPDSDEEPQPAEEKVFTFIDSLHWINIDPRASSDNDARITYMIYETLTRYNVPGSSDELVSPQLATSWEHTEDGLEWTFYLREGVKFHDGADFNAEAVKMSFEKIQELDLSASYLWYPIYEIEVVDDYTVKFYLEWAQPLDVMFSTMYSGWIISPTVLENTEEQFNQGIQSGTGPWVLDEYHKDERALFSRNDDYWGGWTEDQFDRIALEIVLDPATMVQMIQSGEIDGAIGILEEHIPLVDALPDYQTVISSSFQSEHWNFNTGKPPLDDVRVRQALSYSFPYEDCAIAGGALVAPSYAGIPPGQIGYHPGAFQYTYDLEKARSLLKDAGYEDGFTLNFSNFTYWTQATEACPVLWQTELAKLNIELEISETLYETAWAIAMGGPESEGVHDVFRQLWWVAYPTAFDYLYTMYGCLEEDQDILYELSYWCDWDFFDLILYANELEGTDPAEAQAMYEAAIDILVEQAPSIWPRDILGLTVIRSDIQGYVNNPAYNLIYDFYQFTR
ncbi:MAG: ABC transporter substrate-binding protein [Anaerolineales bacterium]